MQTFLPYGDFKMTAKCLDNRRLGKQRVEAHQILNILLDRTKTKGWRNHPAVLMWLGYEDCLKCYYNTILQEWIDRGFNNTMKFERHRSPHASPAWLGNDAFHTSHRSNLLRKDPVHYKMFAEEVTPDLEYVWPSKMQFTSANN